MKNKRILLSGKSFFLSWEREYWENCRTDKFRDIRLRLTGV